MRALSMLALPFGAVLWILTVSSCATTSSQFTGSDDCYSAPSYDEARVHAAIQSNDSGAVRNELGGKTFACSTLSALTRDTNAVGSSRMQAQALMKLATTSSSSACRTDIIHTLVEADVPPLVSMDGMTNVTTLAYYGCKEAVEFLTEKLPPKFQTLVAGETTKDFAARINGGCVPPGLPAGAELFFSLYQKQCASSSTREGLCGMGPELESAHQAVVAKADYFKTLEGRCRRGDSAACQEDYQRRFRGVDGITRVKDWFIEGCGGLGYSVDNFSAHWTLNQVLDGTALFMNVAQGAYYLIGVKGRPAIGSLQPGVSLYNAFDCVKYQGESTARNLQGFPMQVKLYQATACPAQ